MNLRKTLTFSTAALIIGSGMAVANPAAAAPEGNVSVQAGWHTIWGNSWVPAQSSGEWKSGAFKSPSKTTRAVLRCYNTQASMKVRIFEYVGGGGLRKVADSGWKRCNPDGLIIAKGKVKNTRNALKVRLDGHQGSFVRAEKWS
ncbi:hypothetical protein AB0H82_10220 [Streptomyces sp. NPDC050732]|uniref:hypothetical protein n=1 Tax=Streptomyces sp. NPDC050732 TaxID=3154632 RepID=UPI00343B1559